MLKKGRRILSGILAAAMVFAQAPGFAQEVNAADELAFYVSPDGSDSNAGTEEAPFLTVEKARQAVDAINDDMTSDITVYLKDGMYYLNETLKFTEADSGTNGYKVRYTAYENEVPRLSGGQELEGNWELHDEEQNIYKIEVPEGLNFRQLYMDDEKAIRARTGEPFKFDKDSRILGAERFDENGDVIPEWWNSWTEESTVPADGGRIFVPADGRISDEMNNLQDIELHVFTAWSVNILRVNSLLKIEDYNCQEHSAHTGIEIDWDGDAWMVDIQEPEAERIFNRPHPGLDSYAGGPHFAFYYENAYDFIDRDMEWYLDETANVLYYKAKDGQNMDEVTAIVPMIEEVLAVEGTLDNKVHDLEFSGLTFEHSTWLTPSEEGLVGGQAAQNVTYSIYKTNNVGVKREEAGVRIENAIGVRFTDNHVRFMGAIGVLLASGTEEVVVMNNIVEDVAGNGIEIGKFVNNENVDYHLVYKPEDEREVCRNDKILNNVVHKIGTQNEGAVGIGAGYVQAITIANNTVSKCPYSGISVGYGWTSEASPMNNNHIYRNEVFHVNQIVCDGGGIYTLSNQSPGSYIKENYLHDNWLPEGADYGANGLYMDEQTSGYTINDNVIVASYSMGFNRTGYNTVGTNYIYGGSSSDADFKNFLSDRIEEIMENAGVQEDFKESDIYVPEIYSAAYDPYYNRMSITGVSFGNEAKSVVFKSNTGETVVSGDDILSWTDYEIQLLLPENVKAKDSVVVNTMYEKDSNKVYLRSVEKMGEVLIEEDFEAKEEDDSVQDDWDVSVSSKAKYKNSDDNTYLYLNGNNPNLEVTKLGADGKIMTFENNVTQFDFLFEEQMSGYTGLYNLLSTDTAANETFHVNIRPVYGSPVAVENKPHEQLDIGHENLDANVWYTCRTMISGNQLYVNIFEQGEEAPDNWEYVYDMGDSASLESTMNISYYDPDGRPVRIDNVVVTAIEKVEQDKIDEPLVKVASYDMEYTDGKLIDSTKYGNDAEFVGLTASDFETEGDDAVLNFDGSGHYVKLPNGLIESDAFAIEATFKGAKAENSWLWCLGTREGSWPGVTNYVFLSPIFGDGTIRAGIKDSSTEYLFETAKRIEPNEYVTVRIEYNCGDLVMYLDGEKIASMSTTHSVMEILENASAADYCGYIGKSLYNGDAPFNGTLTQFDVYAVREGEMPEPTPIELPYEDVAEKDWFYNAVYYNYVEKLMTGMDENHFGPYGQLSRAQFALILYRMEGSPEFDTDKTFGDVTGNEWYGQAVLWAAEAGVVGGYTNGNFGPADNITREQMALMMYRYAKYLKQDVTVDNDLSAFNDAESVSEFAVDAMKWANGKGIITGKEDGTMLDPQGQTARAEAAAIIQRFMK